MFLPKSSMKTSRRRYLSFFPKILVLANWFRDYNVFDVIKNTYPPRSLVAHSFFDKLSSQALAQVLPLLNGLYIGILSTMALLDVIEKGCQELSKGWSKLSY